MFLLKIMSDQNLPDNDMAKNYKMIAIGSGDQFEFYHDPESGLPMVQVVPKEGESYSVELTGNAYVVSETGKTVSSHWARSLWGRNELKITLGEGDPNPGETIHQIQSAIMEQGIKVSGEPVIETGKALDPHNTKPPAGRPVTMSEVAVAELARRALLSENSPLESKITYTA